MAHNEKGKMRATPRLDGIQEDADGELQEDALSTQRQMQAPPNNSTLAFSTAQRPTISMLVYVLKKMGWKFNREKRKLSRMGEGSSHDSSVQRPNYQDVMIDQPLPMQQTHTSPLIPNPLPNSSRDQPLGVFFKGLKDVKITGGGFSQIYGDVTIHVNSAPREEDEASQEDSLPVPLSSPSQRPRRKPVSPYTPDIIHGHIPPLSSHEQDPSMPIFNIASSHAPQDDHLGPFPSIAIEQGSSTSTTTYSPDNSNKIYERHLGLKQRGFPLWIPEPSRTLPMPYRRKGVSIGDVGIITPSGGFSFLFNICLPHDDPINPSTLPDGFVPITPPIQPTDIREYSEFKPESYLASAAIEKIHNDPSFRGLSFVTSAAEGAVLTLPDGAIAQDLTNIRRFKAYAAANVESWYRYVNGPRGCEVRNGEVRLVTGCVKATSWGMAAVANMSQHKVHYLKYRSIDDVSAPIPPIPLYKWEYTGLAEARVGPDLQEIVNLSSNDDSDVAVEGKYWNQSLFIRTLNVTLSPDVFDAINEELESALIEESRQFHNRGGASSSTNRLPNAGIQTNSNYQQLGTDWVAPTKSTFEFQGSSMKNSASGNIIRERVIMTISPSAPISHPADVLNEILLQKVSNSRVVITHDEHWCSIVNEGDKIMPSPSEIAERVLAFHNIVEEEGVVFLEPKERQSAFLHDQTTVSQSAKEHRESQAHTAGSSRLTGPTIPISFPELAMGSFLDNSNEQLIHAFPINASKTDAQTVKNHADIQSNISNSPFMNGTIPVERTIEDASEWSGRKASSKSSAKTNFKTSSRASSRASSSRLTGSSLGSSTLTVTDASSLWDSNKDDPGKMVETLYPGRAILSAAGADSPKKWVHVLNMSLEELFHGKIFHFRILRYTQIGKKRIVPVDIHIPAGTRAGTEVLLQNLGHEMKDGKYQDISFVVREKHHPRFIWIRDDLLMEVKLPWHDCLLTEVGQVYLRSVDDMDYMFPIDYRSDHSHYGTAIIPDAGMPRRNGIGRGRIAVQWEISSPLSSGWDSIKATFGFKGRDWVHEATLIIRI